MNTILFNDENNENEKENQTMSENKIDISKTKIVTGKIILHHPHLFEKWSYNDSSKAKYSSVIVVNKTDLETIQNINIGINKGIKLGRHKFGGEIPERSSLILPLKDGDSTFVSDIMYKNSYYITASSEYMPNIVDEYRNPVYPYNVPDGQIARVSLLFNPYNINGKKGISCILNNVQIYNERFSVSQRYSTPDEDFS